MRVLLLAGFMMTVMLTQCTKEEIPIPECIRQKIDSIKKEPKATPPIEVNSWLYNGRKVYLFSACCNQLVKLYDANCQYVCAPSGGLTGTGDTLCKDFYQQAQHLSLIWKDDR